jgi:hypothetical protein
LKRALANALILSFDSIKGEAIALTEVYKLSRNQPRSIVRRREVRYESIKGTGWKSSI